MQFDDEAIVIDGGGRRAVWTKLDVVTSFLQAAVAIYGAWLMLCWDFNGVLMLAGALCGGFQGDAIRDTYRIMRGR